MSGPYREQLAAALVVAARTMDTGHTLLESLDAIVAAARTSVPGFDHVGISLTHKNGRVETKAATGDLVWQLDAIQYGLREGPCVTALRQERVVMAENLQSDPRWPNYVPQAYEAGVRAQMAVQLFTNEETLGGLNFYSTLQDTIDPEAIAVAELFAVHAALALGHARKESQLSEALGSRKTIGMAIGIVMERFEISEDRAFQFLIRASQSSNLKLRDVAAELVTQTSERYLGDKPA
jgi:GAF domain-containing protein